MFERVVAPLLTQFLGAYVKEDSFAPEKVQLGIWSGTFFGSVAGTFARERNTA